VGDRERAVVWSQTARDCLDEILGSVAARSPERASRLLDAFDREASSLATLSERGRVVPEIRLERVREIFVQPYRLMYEINADEVRILAILHQAMDFKSRLGGPDA
jgi:toxin ParE1/3/4